ncbi:hypothetical protein [Paenibacillus sp. HW567]|uniref:hypothetical protein n=1 Tax=Paenibacillus sp. HW567 TaxID=1034769 RepID=UPI000363B5C8|nr:hypothetical protein [Paenibacillus sp. HW567]
MKKTIMMKSILAATMLLSVVVGQGSISHATAASPSATAAPVMRDNLSKYGLKKDIELPVTVTAGGLSYTLEKILIYDTKSSTAQGLIKKYGYKGTEQSKYFIWTKITIVNQSGKTVQQNVKDLSDKWRINFGEDAWTSTPYKFFEKTNSTEALWDWSLLPGKQLTTYQGYAYNGEFKWFVIWVDNKNTSGEKYVVNKKEQQ